MQPISIYINWNKDQTLFRVFPALNSLVILDDSSCKFSQDHSFKREKKCMYRFWFRFVALDSIFNLKFWHVKMLLQRHIKALKLFSRGQNLNFSDKISVIPHQNFRNCSKKWKSQQKSSKNYNLSSIFCETHNEIILKKTLKITF